MKIVIRAGGIGTRLWPMSRVHNPKQFQSFVGDKTMLQTTYERIAPLIKEKNDLFISINQKFVNKVKSEISEIDDKNLIIETDTRNTGPAMCLEVCYLERFCDENEVIASLPSDDYISNDHAFRELLITTEEFISENPDYILTPAIIPDYPDTGYSYFKAGENLQEKGEETIYRVADVVEKPNYDYCADIIKTGIYYCHTGMYLWQLKHIVSLFKKMQPVMYDVCSQAVDAMVDKNDYEKASEIYSQLEKISIESVITDHAEKIAMSVSNRIGWSDLGKWHVLKRVLKSSKEENLTKGKVISNESKNNLLYSNEKDKIIVVNDVEDLVVVDTKDALYISSMSKSADIKKIMARIKEEGLDNYL